jgi:hypothetical protein
MGHSQCPAETTGGAQALHTASLAQNPAVGRLVSPSAHANPNTG